MTLSRLLLLSLLLIAGAARAAERPNIVLIIADDQTWHDSGCYGNDVVRTPNIDRLASEGMRFTNCFTATAMCAPTRQQLYTGVFPIRNGAYPNHSKVKPGTKSLVHDFQALGYRVGISGKRHVGPPASFPFDRVGGGNPNLKAIERFLTEDKSQPAFLVVASHSPHQPWKEGDASVYPPEDIKVPPYLVDVPETRQALSRYYAEVTDFDRELGEVDAILKRNGLKDDTIFIYTSEQGAQFPHGKWTCYDVGLHTALIIRWPGHVAAGSVSDALVQYVDLLPTLLDAVGVDPTTVDTGLPGAPDGGTGFDGRSFLDVLTGKKKSHREFVFGVHTTRGIIKGAECYPIRSIRTRTHKLIWNTNYSIPFQNILTTANDAGRGYWLAWKRKAQSDPTARKLVDAYIKRPEFEYYDLENDPYELNNLADKPEYRAKIADLKRRLDEWMTQQGDRGNETELLVAPHPSTLK